MEYTYKVRTVLVKEEGEKYNILFPQDVVSFMQRYTSNFDKEHVYALLLDVKGNVNAICEVSVGTATGSLIHPREVFKSAILANASGIILVHNHPSDDVEPSKLDIEVTETIKKCGEILDIPLKDHLIVSDNSYYSFYESKLI